MGPQPGGLSRGLLLPSAHTRFEGPRSRACLPAVFRLQGLAALLAACSLRARAGLISCRQRSWDSPFGAFSSQKVSGAFPPGRTRVPFLQPVYSRRRRRPARLAAVPGLWPFRESLAAVARLTHRAAGCSRGFSSSGHLPSAPCPDLRPASSHALGFERPALAIRSAPRSFDRRVRRPVLRAANRWQDRINPREVRAPASSNHSCSTPLGLCVHRRSRRALLSTG